METDRLLRQALRIAELDRRFLPRGAAPALVYPAGVHACALRARALDAQLRFAASELGVARVEMTLRMPGDLGQADAVALYERVQHLCDLGYACHFTRLDGCRSLQVRAQVFVRGGFVVEDEFSDVPLVSDEQELARWLRTGYRAARELLHAYAGQAE